MQNVCITPHPTEDRPCTTRFATDLEACPQCNGTSFVSELEFDQIMADLAAKADSKSKRGSSSSTPTASA